MAILDSPLLQRFRHIRHLVLASTVYCNADSSRFSHTIGITEVASRMARVSCSFHMINRFTSMQRLLKLCLFCEVTSSKVSLHKLCNNI